MDIRDFRNYLKLERSLSANSIEAYVRDMEKLSQFVELKHAGLRAEDITYKRLQGFLQYLNELGMSAHSQARILSGIKGFFKYLLFEERIEKDPTALLEGPRLGRKLPPEHQISSQLFQHIFGGAHLELAGAFDVELFNHTIVDHHREALTAMAESAASQVQLQPDSLSEIAVAVGQHGHCGIAIARCPCAHDEGIVDGSADDFIDALGLQRSGIADKAGQVLGRAGRGKGTGH